LFNLFVPEMMGPLMGFGKVYYILTAVPTMTFLYRLRISDFTIWRITAKPPHLAMQHARAKWFCRCGNDGRVWNHFASHRAGFVQ
jgi:hypothetical protein